MTQLSAPHHSFDIALAAKYGIEEAILIHHFQHWIGVNQRLKKNFHEGKTWTYQTMDEIAAHFPYLTKQKIIDLLDKLATGKSRFSKKPGLEFEPVLKKGNFNKSPYDRTIWYTFTDSFSSILWKHKIEIGDTQNENCGATRPIPDTITDAKTNLKNKQKETTVDEDAAKAADEDLVSSKISFSQEVTETASSLIRCVKEVKPDFVLTQKNQQGILTCVDLMLRKDHRNAKKLIEVFRWALFDDFWNAKMFKPNPAKYLREKFDQLEMQMISKPSGSKNSRAYIGGKRLEEYDNAW